MGQLRCNVMGCLNKLIQCYIVIQVIIKLVLIILQRLKLLLGIVIECDLRESEAIPKHVASMHLEVRSLITQFLHFRVTLDLLLAGEGVLQVAHFLIKTELFNGLLHLLHKLLVFWLVLLRESGHPLLLRLLLSLLLSQLVLLLFLFLEGLS